MKSILIIIPYFGKFPKAFKFWLNSAYSNSSIDFLLVTDQNLKSEFNVQVVTMSFNSLKEFIQSKFDFKIEIPSPYKLCDFRGAYGYIFSDFIEKYDFWGFGDIDLVYGNIREFFTNSVLSNYAVLSGYGHLTLYRNCELCNCFFKTRLEDFQFYRNVFSNPKNTVFDEYLHRGLSDMWKHLYPNLVWDKKPFDDILVPRLSFNFVSIFNSRVSKNLIFEYSNGELYRIFTDEQNNIIKEPTLYAHFQQRKFMKVSTNCTDRYLIVPNSYIDYTEISLVKLSGWCKPREFYRIYWNLKNKVIRRLKRCIPILLCLIS